MPSVVLCHQFSITAPISSFWVVRHSKDPRVLEHEKLSPSRRATASPAACRAWFKHQQLLPCRHLPQLSALWLRQQRLAIASSCSQGSSFQEAENAACGVSSFQLPSQKLGKELFSHNRQTLHQLDADRLSMLWILLWKLDARASIRLFAWPFDS